MSLDTAIHEEDCNLADGASAASLQRLCEAGILFDLRGATLRNVVGGAQCARSCHSTWPTTSQAKFPPMGMNSHLSIHELRQLDAGSSLMLRTMHLAVLLQGGASGREHPGLPQQPEMGSLAYTCPCCLLSCLPRYSGVASGTMEVRGEVSQADIATLRRAPSHRQGPLWSLSTRSSTPTSTTCWPG